MKMVAVMQAAFLPPALRAFSVACCSTCCNLATGSACSTAISRSRLHWRRAKGEAKVEVGAEGEVRV